MTKKTRLIILLFCVVCFFAIAPILVAYSMGYRYDFEKNEVVATGGIYVRTFPTAENIIIDSKISEKPGLFANSIFVQSLLPKNHTVFIQKTGYYDYSKTLPVQESQVTKLENVLLFKKSVKFEPVKDTTLSPFLPQNQPEKFIIKNNNLYYSEALQNSTLTELQKETAVIKKIYAFAILDSNIIWLSPDGFLYKSDALGKNPQKISAEPLKVNAKNFYKITVSGQKIFLNNNGEIFLLNPETNIFDDFKISAKDLKFSPDSQNLVYYNNSGIYLYYFQENLIENNVQIFSGNKIASLQWLNNDYIIFTADNKVIISEIDYRGNINATTLPEIKSSSTFFNSQTGKLYALSGNSLLVSEKLTP